MRVFVALHVPSDLLEAIEADIVDALRPRLPQARWTRPEGRHLTLKFLGEVAEERLPDVGAALGSAATSHDAFEASFATVGGFPNIRRPRVLWVGIGQGAEPMGRLATSVSEALKPLGFEPEKRPFAGHLTVARFKVPEPIEELPEVGVPSTPFDVREIVLFRSQLHPKGARYTVLERYPLRED